MIEPVRDWDYVHKVISEIKVVLEMTGFSIDMDRHILEEWLETLEKAVEVP